MEDTGWELPYIHKKRKLDPKIIREGDTVKVIVPKEFIRCGYPMDLKDFRVEVKKTHQKAIDKFLNSIGIATWDSNSSTSKQILNAITYALAKQKSFGGSERALYTKDLPVIKDIIFPVHGIHFVKTGFYEEGYSYSSEDGEYEPPYLSSEKTHKILKLHVFDHYNVYKQLGYSSYFFIEASNVEKVLL
jgi:hypothetical protein